MVQGLFDQAASAVASVHPVTDALLRRGGPVTDPDEFGTYQPVELGHMLDYLGQLPADFVQWRDSNPRSDKYNFVFNDIGSVSKEYTKFQIRGFDLKGPISVKLRVLIKRSGLYQPLRKPEKQVGILSRLRKDKIIRNTPVGKKEYYIQDLEFTLGYFSGSSHLIPKDHHEGDAISIACSILKKINECGSTSYIWRHAILVDISGATPLPEASDPRTVPMRDSDPTIISIDGVWQEQLWNMKNGECVIDYLKHCAKSSRKHTKLAEGTARKSARDYWVDEFRKSDPGFDPSRGITVEQIEKLEVNMTFAAFTADMSCVAHKASDGKRDSIGCVFLVVAGTHCLPIEAPEVIRRLVKKLTTHEAGVYYVMEEKTREAAPAAITEAGSLEDILEEDKCVWMPSPKDGQTPSLMDLVTMVREHPWGMSGAIIPQVFTRRGRVTRVRVPQGKEYTEVTYDSEAWLCKEVAEMIGVQYTGQGVGSLANAAAKRFIPQLPTSSFNEVTQGIFNVGAFANTVFERPTKPHLVQAWDKNRCYTTCIKGRQSPWPVFTQSDYPEPYSGTILPGSWYYLVVHDMSDFLPTKGTGWHDCETTKYLLDAGCRCTVEQQLVPSGKLPHDFFVTFIKQCNAVLGQHAKYVCNAFVGTLGCTTRDRETQAYLLEHAGLAVEMHVRRGFNIAQEGDLYLLSDNKVDKLYSHNKPMYASIIQAGWVWMHRLYKTLCFGASECRLLAIRTDEIVVQRRAPLMFQERNFKGKNHLKRAFAKWSFFHRYKLAKVPRIGEVNWSCVVQEPPKPQEVLRVEEAPSTGNLLVLGKPGSGKTTLLRELVSKHEGEYKLVAFTHTAADNIGGETFHAGLGIEVSTGRATARTHATMKLLSEDSGAVFVDEVFMLPQRLVHLMHQLKSTYPKVKWLCFGDPNQCRAIETPDDPDESCVADWAVWAIDSVKRIDAAKYREGDERFAEYRLELKDVCELAKAQDYRCHKTKARLAFNQHAPWDTRASLHRKDNRKPHTIDNLVIVSHSQNIRVGDRDSLQDDVDSLEADKLKVLHEICGNVMELTEIHRNKDMAQHLDDLLEDRLDFARFAPKGQMCLTQFAYTNRECMRRSKEVNDWFLTRNPGIRVTIPKSQKLHSQEMVLTEGTRLICRQTDRSLDVYNGRRYTVEGLDKDTVWLRPETEGLDGVVVDTGVVGDLFTYGWCTTVHRAQGRSVDEPYLIHEFFKMDKWIQYTALSRTTKAEYVQIADVSDLECYTEYASVEAAKWLLGQDLYKLLWTQKNQEEYRAEARSLGKKLADERKTKNLKGKVTSVREYCKRVVACKGAVKMYYKYARTKNEGRIFGVGPCMQRLPGQVRGLLLRMLPYETWDVDMKNCHPVILLEMAKEMGLETPCLRRYVEDRDAVLAEGLTKTELLIMINRDKRSRTTHPFARAFDDECKMIQRKAWDFYPRKDPKPTNPRGSHLNTILCSRENALIHKAMAISQGVFGPYFDGFVTSAKPDLAALEEATGMVWTIKPHDESIRI